MRKKLLCALTCFVMLFSLALSGCGKTEVTIGDAIYNEKTGEMETRHLCPFADTYAGYADEMCRNCCGLGI